MKIRAAEAKRADGGAARMIFRRRPNALLRVDVKRRFAGFKGGCGLFNFNGRRQRFVIERERDFDQTSDPGGGFGMADLRFDRSQGAFRAVLMRRKKFDQPLDFHRVADRRAGAVGFQQFNRVRRNARVAVGVAVGFHLAFGFRRVN